jgi:hypothetical protein
MPCVRTVMVTLSPLMRDIILQVAGQLDLVAALPSRERLESFRRRRNRRSQMHNKDLMLRSERSERLKHGPQVCARCPPKARRLLRADRDGRFAASLYQETVAPA